MRYAPLVKAKKSIQYLVGRSVSVCAVVLESNGMEWNENRQDEDEDENQDDWGFSPTYMFGIWPSENVLNIV